MRKLSVLFALVTLLVFCWGILQAAAPAMLPYCEINCPEDYICAATAPCYCLGTTEPEYTCYDYWCGTACQN
jgi:hypothetical protein